MALRMNFCLDNLTVVFFCEERTISIRFGHPIIRSGAKQNILGALRVRRLLPRCAASVSW
jgi:hypothetical protein